MKRLLYTALFSLIVFVAVYHGFRHLAVGPWGWQWEDITLGASMFFTGVVATLYYIRYFSWRDKIKAEELETWIKAHPIPEDLEEVSRT